MNVMPSKRASPSLTLVAHMRASFFDHVLHPLTSFAKKLFTNTKLQQGTLSLTFSYGRAKHAFSPL